MGISIQLNKKPYVSIEDQTKSKLLLTSEVCKSLAYHFEPKSVEVWKNASNESFGGIRIGEPFDISEDPSLIVSALDQVQRKYRGNLDLLYHLVVKIRGIWTFDNIHVGGYVETTNDTLWARSLGDIELDVYATKEVSDIVDLFWRGEQVDALVEQFIERFSGFEDDSHILVDIVFALGAPFEALVSDWYTSYSKVPHSYFQTFLRTMETLQPDIYTYVRLINRRALTSDLYDIDYFKQYLDLVGNKNQP